MRITYNAIIRILLTLSLSMEWTNIIRKYLFAVIRTSVNSISFVQCFIIFVYFQAKVETDSFHPISYYFQSTKLCKKSEGSLIDENLRTQFTMSLSSKFRFKNYLQSLLYFLYQSKSLLLKNLNAPN